MYEVRGVKRRHGRTTFLQSRKKKLVELNDFTINLILGDRLTAGRQNLDLLIGVQIPVPQQSFAKATELHALCITVTSYLAQNHIFSTLVHQKT